MKLKYAKYPVHRRNASDVTRIEHSSLVPGQLNLLIRKKNLTRLFVLSGVRRVCTRILSVTMHVTHLWYISFLFRKYMNVFPNVNTYSAYFISATSYYLPYFYIYCIHSYLVSRLSVCLVHQFAYIDRWVCAGSCGPLRHWGTMEKNHLPNVNHWRWMAFCVEYLWMPCVETLVNAAHRHRRRHLCHHSFSPTTALYFFQHQSKKKTPSLYIIRWRQWFRYESMEKKT